MFSPKFLTDFRGIFAALIISFASLIDAQAEPPRQCKDLLTTPVRIKINGVIAKGYTVVLDTHLFTAQRYRVSVLGAHFRSEFFDALHAIADKYQVKPSDSYNMLFGGAGKKQFLAKHALTESELRTMNYAITLFSGPYISFLSFVPELLISRGVHKSEIHPAQTAGSLIESFGSDFDFDDESLQFISKGLPTNDLYLKSLTSPASHELTEYISQGLASKQNDQREIIEKLRNFGVGGANGVGDRKILSEVFASVREPDARVIFVTADQGIAKNLLKLKYLKQRDYVEAIKFMTQKPYLATVPDGIEGTSYGVLKPLDNVRFPIERTARATWFKDLSLVLRSGQVLTIDLMFCKIFDQEGPN